MADSRPIGIFDSGIGGLTVASALHRKLPGESLIYFGDTAHLPYGDKSKESINQYSRRITEFLLDLDCKAVIVACNTASAYGFESVKKVAKDHMTFNVIDPIVEYVSANKSVKKVGVIGTQGTIASRVYPKRIKALNPSLEVVTQATPLLAPMIEEGFYNNSISQSVINSYLSKKAFTGIQALILGCTHYPLIKAEVQRFYGEKVNILDSADVVASHVAAQLKKHKALAPDNHKGIFRFFVSDYTRSFEKSTRIFFGSQVQLEERRIWG